MPRLIKAATLGALDQGVVSATNLFIGMFLVHSGSKDGYGLYGIAYSSVLLAVGIANAVITTQMTVIAPEKKDLERYCSNMLAAQLLVFVPGCVVLALSAVLMFLLGALDGKYFGIAVMAMVSIPGVLLLEYFKRYFYLLNRPRNVVSLDVALLGIMVLLLSVGRLFDYKTLYIVAIAGYGLGGYILGGAAYYLAGLSFDGIREVISALKESWQQGRWALGGVIATWLQTQSYVYLLGGLLGPAAVGEANAARLLMSPVAMLTAAFNRVFLPRLSMMKRSQERKDAEQLARKVTLTLLSVISVYSVLMLLSYETIRAVVLSAQYQIPVSMVLLWSLVFAFQAIRLSASLMLQVYRRFRDITNAIVISASIAVISSYLLIHQFAVQGGIAALALSEMLLAAMLWRVYGQVKPKSKN